MHINKWILVTGLSAAISFNSAHALTLDEDVDDFGQLIKIQTSLKSFIGKPSWLLIIRDLEHNQNIPYLFDFTQNDNLWIALTYGRDYTIVVSELKMMNKCGFRTIHNFCGLESMGRIQHGKSYSVEVTGKLNGNPDRVSCKVLKYKDLNFTIGKQES